MALVRGSGFGVEGVPGRQVTSKSLQQYQQGKSTPNSRIPPIKRWITMCGRVGLTPASTLEELPSSEIGIHSHSKLGTQMSRQIRSKYKHPVCGKLDNDVWRWFGVPRRGGVRRKLPPNPYRNISRPSQLRFQESHLGKLDNNVWAGCMGKAIYCCVGTGSGFQGGGSP